MYFKHEPWRPDPSVADETSSWSTEHELDLAREHIEFGPAGDIDAGEHNTRHAQPYVPWLKRTVSIWLRLYEQVQQGEVGGECDGIKTTQSKY